MGLRRPAWTKLWGINTLFVRFIPQSLVLRSIVWDWILIYRNWSIHSYCRHESNLVPRAHLSFGQHQDTELWNNQFPETKILGLPVSRPMCALVYMASRNKVDVDAFHKSIQYALESLGKMTFGLKKQKTHGLWERAYWLFQSSVSWCWPKDTWALGTRLPGRVIVGFHMMSLSNYRTIDPAEILLSWCIRAPENYYSRKFSLQMGS